MYIIGQYTITHKGVYADAIICNTRSHIRKMRIPLLDIRIRIMFLLTESVRLLQFIKCGCYPLSAYR
jgi:hypothetical protein